MDPTSFKTYPKTRAVVNNKMELINNSGKVIGYVPTVIIVFVAQ